MCLHTTKRIIHKIERIIIASLLVGIIIAPTIQLAAYAVLSTDSIQKISQIAGEIARGISISDITEIDIGNVLQQMITQLESIIDQLDANYLVTSVSSEVDLNSKGPLSQSIFIIAQKQKDDTGILSRVVTQVAQMTSQGESAIVAIERVGIQMIVGQQQDCIIIQSAPIIKNRVGSSELLQGCDIGFSGYKGDRTGHIFATSIINTEVSVDQIEKVLRQIILEIAIRGEQFQAQQVTNQIANNVANNPTGSISQSISDLAQLQVLGRINDANLAISQIANLVIQGGSILEIPRIVQAILEPSLPPAEEDVVPPEAQVEKEPDKETVCLYNPNHQLCDPDDEGQCPPGWAMNENERCFPANQSCPPGYWRPDDDETGACVKKVEALAPPEVVEEEPPEEEPPEEGPG